MNKQMVTDMQTLQETLTHDQYLQLKDLLGCDSRGNLKDVSLEVNTDRNDTFLASSVIKFAEQVKKIAEIVGSHPEDIITEHDYDSSDHEIVVHMVSLNNSPIEGHYVVAEGHVGVFQTNVGGQCYIKTNTGIENVSFCNIRAANWDEVFTEEV